MGARNFTTYIKLESPELYPIDKIAKGLFNSTDVILGKFDDSRSTNLTVGLHESGIILSNLDLNYQVMREHSELWINKLYEFFDQPEYIVAYMISDFNNAAGYTVIKGGKVIRSRYFDPQDEIVHSHDIGEHLKEEEKSINEIMSRPSYDSEKKMSFTKMYYTDKIEFFHYTDIGMVETITQKYLGFGAYWGPDNVEYNLIKMNQKIREIL